MINRRTLLKGLLSGSAAMVCYRPLAADSSNEIIIGLDADMTAGSARAGAAIQRGAAIAIAEINQAGGVLGRGLKLVIRDHRGNPARGVANIDAFAATKNLVAVIGGLHTPVALRELETIHRHQVIYLDPWAAGTSIIENGFEPNYAFRVSVRDEYAGSFLIKEMRERGFERPGLLLEKTGWGKSNLRAMTDALTAQDKEPVGVQWFSWGVKNLSPQIRALQEAGTDVVMFVGNAPEGLTVVRSMASHSPKQRLPIMSHWGITGGEFASQAGDALSQVDLVFLQTFSFLDPTFKDRADQVVRAYKAMFPGTEEAKDIFAPVGTAHAYDLVHLLARAIADAGSIHRPDVRDALEIMGTYDGLVRRYDPAFTPNDHDALGPEDLRLARYSPDGSIVPATVESDPA